MAVGGVVDSEVAVVEEEEVDVEGVVVVEGAVETSPPWPLKN